MKHIFCLIACSFLLVYNTKAQNISYKYQQNRSFTVDEVTEAYRLLQKKYPKLCNLQEIGISDIGRPIHLFVISEDGNFSPDAARKKGKLVLFVNNGIHAGEPPGVDASVKFAEDVLSQSKNKKLLDDVVICIIPFYNVDGGLNRSCCSRTNQNGPEEYGFRGNGQNRDRETSRGRGRHPTSASGQLHRDDEPDQRR
jgi:murein tripeptide amidase MpaA